MINSLELRIGNYVYDDFNEVHRVECIKSNTFVKWDEGGPETVIFSKLDDRNSIYTCDEVNPIPLTEEWLKKCGMFKYKDHIPYSYVFNVDKKLGFNRFRLQYAHYGDGSEGFYNLFLNKVQSAKIEYVHQLQNLIYALDGKELEVTI